MNNNWNNGPVQGPGYPNMKPGTFMPDLPPAQQKPNRKNGIKFLIAGLVCAVFLAAAGVFGYQVIKAQTAKNYAEWYAQASQLYKDDEFEEAHDLFKKMPGYEDSDEKAESCAVAIQVLASDEWNRLESNMRKVYGDDGSQILYLPDNRSVAVCIDTDLDSRNTFVNKIGTVTSSLKNAAITRYQNLIQDFHTKMKSSVKSLNSSFNESGDMEDLGVELMVVLMDSDDEILLCYCDGRLIGGSEYEYGYLY